jgi:hypothetical protein
LGVGAELLYTDPFRVSCYLHAITYMYGVFISKELHNTDSMNFVKTFLNVWYCRSVWKVQSDWERLICIFLAFDFCHLLLLYLQHLPRVFDVDLFFYNLILRISVIDLDPWLLPYLVPWYRCTICVKNENVCLYIPVGTVLIVNFIDQVKCEPFCKRWIPFFPWRRDLKIPVWENVKLKNSNPVGKYSKIGFLPPTPLVRICLALCKGVRVA